MFRHGIEYISNSDEVFNDMVYLVDAGTDIDGENILIVSNLRSRDSKEVHEIFRDEKLDHLGTLRIAKQPDVFNYQSHKLLGDHKDTSFYDIREEDRENYRRNNSKMYDPDEAALTEIKDFLSS